MANCENISISGTSYAVRDTTKALKTEAIKSITRSGTTFTATRCDNTTFTFTQQDNNTTTGTTYAAGSVPANTTFGTNGSIKNVYDNLNTNKAPKTVVSTSANGLAPKVTDTGKFLKGDGTWSDPRNSILVNLQVALSPSTTTQTYSNNALKSHDFVDILLGNTSAVVINRCVRVYGNATTSVECRNGKDYSETVTFTYNEAAGTIDYTMSNIEGWTSNVVTIANIIYPTV